MTHRISMILIALGLASLTACAADPGTPDAEEAAALREALESAGPAGIVTDYYPCTFATGVLTMWDEIDPDGIRLGWRVVDADRPQAPTDVRHVQLVNCEAGDVTLLGAELELTDGRVYADGTYNDDVALGQHTFPWRLRGIGHEVRTSNGDPTTREAIGDADFYEAEFQVSVQTEASGVTAAVYRVNTDSSARPVVEVLF